MTFAPSKQQLFCTAGILFIALSGIGWSWPEMRHPGQTYSLYQDTVAPGKKNQPDENLDRQLDQLDKALKHLDDQLDNKHLEKMQRDLEASLSRINIDQVQQQVEAALQQIDMEKVRLETEAALKKVDLAQIQAQVQAAMKDADDKIDWKEMDREIKQSMEAARKSLAELKNIDLEKIKADMAGVKKELAHEKSKMREQLQEAKKDVNKAKIDMKAKLEKARKSVAASKKEWQGYKTMIGKMEAAGLLNSEGDYTIEYKGGKLSINGQEQPGKIRDDYKQFFKKGDTKLTSKNGSFSVDKDQ